MSAEHAAAIGDPVAWHDAECGRYRADLPAWERLANETGGKVLELGAGSGRVTLHLAAEGHAVTALDRDPRLLAALGQRAHDRGLAVETVVGDARDPGALGPFALVIAPMQLLHLLDDRADRARLLAWVTAALAPSGRFAAALLDDREPLAPGFPEPIPDVREVDGWIHSSLPLELAAADGAIEVHRLRQLVSPEGELSEERNVVRLATLSPAQLESEAHAAGLGTVRRVELPPTEDHVGSVIVVLERPA